MRLTRRGLLIGAGGAGALLVAFALSPRRYPGALVAGPGEHVFDSFLRLAADGAVSVAVPVCEMGQGVTTLMAQIVAVELGADWKRVGAEPAPPSPVYGDAVLAARWAALWQPGYLPALADTPDDWLARLHAEREPMMITAEGTAIAAFEGPLRAAAAALRAMLMQAAAARWNLGWETLDTADHFVVNGKQRLAFAALIADAMAYDPPDPPALRADPAKERPGQFPDGARPRFPRLDLPAKVDGSFVFAGDVRVPGMVHAAIVHGPQGDTVLSSFDRKAAETVPGVVGVVQSRRWVAAAARTWHAAHKAVLAMEPRFHAAGRIADSAALENRIDTALRKGTATRLLAEGDPDALLAKPSLTARYDVEAALHAPLETATATARLTGDKLELWLATQAPELVRRQAARAAGVPRSHVVVYPMHAGGSFDARLDARIAVEAVSIAKALGRPVQLMWSRWEESLAGYPRTPVSALLSAAIGPDKRQLLGW
ncbi:MAG: molybdopterin-dependent oxidoreductase, partial [Novosphingobium sp.]|nr:molybdopterin-dependent oxidoreductase [Novosphingobium sp.]